MPKRVILDDVCLYLDYRHLVRCFCPPGCLNGQVEMAKSGAAARMNVAKGQVITPSFPSL